MIDDDRDALQDENHDEPTDAELPPPGDELLGFLGATRQHLDAALAASTARPDLAASVARARELDPTAVSAAAVREVAQLPPIAQLRPRAAAVRENMSDQTALAPFTAALRDHLDADLARQIHRTAIASATAPHEATPGAPPASVAAAPRATVVPLAHNRRPLVALALALAAAMVLAIGLRGAFQASEARPGAIPGAAALAALRTSTGQVELRDPPRSVTERPVPEDIRPVPEDTLEVPDPKASQPEPEPEPAPSPRPRVRKPAPPATPPVDPPASETPREDPLAALDREAQARWQSGDLRGAADKFAEIVRRAPGTRAAETAYGDLFALEHQLGGEPVTLWRAYLQQFPRGRYADDARAGVCRREPADAAPQCWRDYLAAHPDGAHRREAEQAAP